jgi:3D-(3,5/4)-trihydroxycyclohexane-1,2-dione acylhydrolase (decyclizing)
VGDAYCLHTPQALGTMLRRGLARVDAPHGAGPFFALLPLNTQPARLPAFNLDELPCGAPPTPGPAASPEGYRAAVEALTSGAKVVVKVGGGARGCAAELAELLELADAVAVVSPVSTGLVAYENPRNMLVAGSKGTICGNYATDEAEVLVVVGARGVCQSDSSRTAYPGVRQVININADPGDALHYSKTIPLVGDAKATLAELNRALRLAGAAPYGEALSPWLAACQTKRREWEAFKAQRYERPTLHDEVWGGEVLTQPAAIKIVTDWARTTGAVAFFDAGDVQANGFQVVEDDREGRTYSDSGASYMGFAASALLATAAAPDPFYGVALSGDGSFMMSPQILIDGVEQGATGCVVLLDNRRMAAISSLQQAQYGVEFATNDSVAVDYVAMASAFEGVLALDGGRSPESLAQSLERARAHQGLSLIHVPVYYGPDPLGGLGAYGRWNVGNWVDEVQTLRHRIGL